MSRPSGEYEAEMATFEGHRAYIQEAVDLAEAEVDFSGYDQIVVLVGPEVRGISSSRAFVGGATNGIQADGRVIPNAVTAGSDSGGWGPLWLNHEAGHSFGLADLYAFDYDTAVTSDQHRFVGGFSLMGFIGGRAPEQLAWERWQLGWLADNQIACQTTSRETTVLLPIETPGGTKAVIVPIGGGRAVVVESRRQLGHDTLLRKEGALVYVVDPALATGTGPIQVVPASPTDALRDQSPLAEGESVTIEGVTVTVVHAGPDGDTVEVTTGG